MVGDMRFARVTSALLNACETSEARASFKPLSDDLFSLPLGGGPLIQQEMEKLKY
jgi:hypothetical protein